MTKEQLNKALNSKLMTDDFPQVKKVAVNKIAKDEDRICTDFNIDVVVSEYDIESYSDISTRIYEIIDMLIYEKNMFFEILIYGEDGKYITSRRRVK